MTALETLLAAIDTMRAKIDGWGAHWDGCEAEHPRCAVYRAADAARAEGISVPAELCETVCRWEASKDRTIYSRSCGGYWFASDGRPGDVAGITFCPSCGGRIAEVADG